MIQSCATIALVPEIKTGPWIYWHDLPTSLAHASSLGFDAVELFTASHDALDIEETKALLEKYALKIAAVGTGAGKVIHGLTLTDPNESIRKKAIEFIQQMISMGAEFQAPAIIGSMQGNVAAGIERKQALDWLAEGLRILGNHAGALGVSLIYEPLNRYETNLINTLEDGVLFLNQHSIQHVGLLADLFHMNIEEEDMAASILKCKDSVLHVHFADSNRRPVGNGHSDLKEVAKALKEIKYDKFVSAEAFPWPNSQDAASQTIRSFQHYFKP
ncbi:TIM barrel protein [Aquirufa sp. ROCK-SH2]